MGLNQTTWILIIVIAVAILTAVGQLAWLMFGPCQNKTDLVFMLDDSGSIKNADFEKTKGFVKKIVSSPDITVNEDSVNVALCRFSDQARWMDITRKEFLSDKPQIDKTLKSYKRDTQQTNMVGALKFVDKTVLKEGRGDHKETVLIFLTDGKSTYKNQPQQLSDIKKQAKRLKDKGVQIYSLGVGDEIEEAELKAIASEPAKKYVKEVADFDELDKFAEEIGSEICEPTYGLVAVPLGIAILFIALGFYLDWKEADDLIKLGEGAIFTKANK